MNPPSAPLAPAAFFDRDGVVNLSPGSGYVLRPDNFHLTPGIAEVLAECREFGLKLVLVTSQQGVGKGEMSQADLDAVHAKMQAELGASGAAFDDIRSCTHVDGTCECRKPSPKMILAAARDLRLDLAHSFLVGDHDRDIEMARRANLHTAIRWRDGTRPETAEADFTVESAAELLAVIRSGFWED